MNQHGWITQTLERKKLGPKEYILHGSAYLKHRGKKWQNYNVWECMLKWQHHKRRQGNDFHKDEDWGSLWNGIRHGVDLWGLGMFCFFMWWWLPGISLSDKSLIYVFPIYTLLCMYYFSPYKSYIYATSRGWVRTISLNGDEEDKKY